MSEVWLSTYDSRWRTAFVELNREWIETHFRIEPMDLAQLENLEQNILGLGGEIFFLIENEVALATCAMVPHGKHGFELAKMAVRKDARGRGLGDRILVAAMEWARGRGALEVTLLSNTILAPAIALYKKHGFRTVHLGPHPDYERCNIEMKREMAHVSQG